MNQGSGKPTITVVPDYATMSAFAADRVAAAVAADPHAAIAVPTGSSPLGMFAEIIARVQRGELDLGLTDVFCIDEYVGVMESDPNSLTGWLRRSLLDQIGVEGERVHTIPVGEPDPIVAAAGFEAELAAHGGLALAVLGLGANGHIAYNEPGAAADSRTRLVTLSPESISAAAKYWQDTVPIPDQAMTIGVGTLLEARRIVLIVSGEAKAEILRRAWHDPMSADVPASWLRLAGDRFEVIADEAAVKLLSL